MLMMLPPLGWLEHSFPLMLMMLAARELVRNIGEHDARDAVRGLVERRLSADAHDVGRPLAG